MDIKCNKCLRTLLLPGALIFGPPDENDQVLKYHLCRSCYLDLGTWFTLPSTYECLVNDSPRNVSTLSNLNKHAYKEITQAIAEFRYCINCCLKFSTKEVYAQHLLDAEYHND